MASAFNDLEIVFLNAKDKSIFLVDSDAPITPQIPSERFRISSAVVPVPGYIKYETVYSFQRLLIL